MLPLCEIREATGLVIERAVARGLARKQATAIIRIGVEEKAFRKGHRHLTIAHDVDHGAAAASGS